MPRLIENQRVYRRYRNGGCVMDRICRSCGRSYRGEHNLCQLCRNQKRRKNGKPDTEYHKKHSISTFLHAPGDLTQEGQIAEQRKAAFENQKERIQTQLAAIANAGLDPNEDSVETIEMKIGLSETGFSPAPAAN